MVKWKKRLLICFVTTVDARLGECLKRGENMKILKSIIALLLTIVSAFMTGCSGTELRNMNVDDSLRSLAQSQAEGLTVWEDLKGGLEIVKLEDRYDLVDALSKNTVHYIDKIHKFYEPEDPYKNFVFEESKYELAPEVWENLEKSKNIGIWIY